MGRPVSGPEQIPAPTCMGTSHLNPPTTPRDLQSKVLHSLQCVWEHPLPWVALLPLHICKDPHGPGMIDGATLKTGRSMRHKTLLLVGDMRGAVVVTSVLILRKFLLKLPKFGFVTYHGGNKSRRVCESHDFTRIITYQSISKNTWLAIRVNLCFSKNISPNLLGLGDFLQNY